MNRLTRAAVLAAPALLLLSACGGGNGYGTTATATDSAAGSSTSPSTSSAGSGLHVASTSLGRIVVDSAGRTVYLLTADGPHHSTCSAACLQYWPVVAPGHAAASVTGAVGTTTTTAGKPIATVGGWPVYTFVQDAKPGDVTGESMASFGGTWYAVSPSGHPVKAASSGTRSSSPGRGY